MKTMTRARRLLMAAVLAGTAATAIARSDPAAPAPDMPDTAALTEQLTTAPKSELELMLAPLTTDGLTALSESAMDLLQSAAYELSEALIAQQRAHADPDATPEQRATADERVETLATRRAELVSRTEAVLTALKEKGGDVAASRAYITAVERNLVPPTEPPGPADDQRTPEERAAAAVDEAVADAILAVRDQPPAHERPEPWKVPVGELQLELQPLRVGEVDERVVKWVELLQREVRRRIRIDIALTRVKDAAQRTELAERSAAQQEIIKKVVERVQAALIILQKRGGDVEEYKQYIATATGQKLNLTDPSVLFAQATAWVRSPDGGIKLGLNILQFIGLLLAFYVLSRILGRAANTALGRVPKASSLLRRFLVGGTRRLTMLIGLVIAVSTLGVNITPLVAAIGAAGLVIGLALQGTLSNFASGILILFYRPFDVGDAITGGGVTGKVESMSLVSTSILTFDNQVMIVPNNEIWNGVITNVTGRNTRRIDLVFGISYADDIGRAVTELEAAMADHEKILDDPAPVVRVCELGDNSVNIIARPWVRTSDYWEVHGDLMRGVKERFDAAGLNIPFPQRDLHVPGTIEVKLAGADRLAAADDGVIIETMPKRTTPAGTSDDDTDRI